MLFVCTMPFLAIGFCKCFLFHALCRLIIEHIGRLVRMSVSGYRGRRFEPRHNYWHFSVMVFHFIRIASVDSAVK